MPAHERDAGWRGAGSVVDEILALGRNAVGMTCDVTRPSDVAACFERAEKELGPVTGLVNNAGIASEAAAASIIDMPDDLWFRTIDINLNGVYRMSKAAGQAMRAHGLPSAIVNISSLAGRFGFANYGGYCASKFGVIGLTQQMACELGPLGIRVNCVCPGSIDTDMLDGTMRRKAMIAAQSFGEFMASYNLGIIPMGRRGDASEQAATVAFLLSSDASYITGQSINVDGGYRMD
jgi:3-oxoacyl-[acyl-carrier protein] reductase/meso-butanediol dehydrogenase/(S,S)-butanediol dehydrogenase/diacetyl reductase